MSEEQECQEQSSEGFQFIVFDQKQKCFFTCMSHTTDSFSF